MPEAILLAKDHPRSTLSRLVKQGSIVRIARGVYVRSKVDPEGAVARYWRDIVGYLAPEAVITDRSARTGGPANGVLYLASQSKWRVIELPGMKVAIRPGLKAMEGDAALPSGIYLASRPRALLENSMPSRSVSGMPRRTLTEAELEDWIDRLAYIEGSERLVHYREQLVHTADILGISGENVAHLKRLIGSALGSQQVKASPAALDARQKGTPYDPDRIARFGILAVELAKHGNQSHPATYGEPKWRNLPFFEAYFSNYIEGTEFTLDEALDVVYENKIPTGRPQDSHDLIGTHEIVSDQSEMSRLASSADEFLEILRYRHAIVLGGRKESNPGRFKLMPNRAGQSLFVDPTLVEGTLRMGFERLGTLDTPWQRAAYVMFLVSEVHPFDDGNGRMARIMMNSELVAGNQARIIIPTVFRDDYLGGLRRFTREDDPGVLTKALRYAHDYTAGIDFSDIPTATSQLEQTHAFDEPDSPRRLILYSHDVSDLSAKRRRGS